MTKAMKIKYLDNNSERRIDTTHWKPRSLIVLEDGTSLISSNDAKLEKENCPMCGRQLTFEAHNYNIGLADD